MGRVTRDGCGRRVPNNFVIVWEPGCKFSLGGNMAPIQIEDAGPKKRPSTFSRLMKGMRNISRFGSRSKRQPKSFSSVTRTALAALEVLLHTTTKSTARFEMLVES